MSVNTPSLLPSYRNMAYQYPPSPRTILPCDLPVRPPATPLLSCPFRRTVSPSDDVAGDAEPTPPNSTPTSQGAPDLFLTTPSDQHIRLFLSTRPSCKMKVATDLSNPSLSSSSSALASASRLCHPPNYDTPTEPTNSHTFHGKAPVRNVRRQSRFDPIAKEDEQEEGYGDLAQRHPLRRVGEGDTKEGKGIILPGIRALFGAAAEHSPSPSSPSLFHSPSLPHLTPNSPTSSPSTARTSRYSSQTSSVYTPSESILGHSGWWAPDFDRFAVPGSSTLHHTFPISQPYYDEHAKTRRRSDGPPPLRDPEAALLRWQAQSRNASFPSTGCILTGSGQGLRSLMHPPLAASATMISRASSSGHSTPLSPHREQPDYPFDRRSSSARKPSVGGQLAQSFADLTAAEREREGSSPPVEMPPPMPPLADRRLSTHPTFASSEASVLLQPPSALPLSRPTSVGPPPDTERSRLSQTGPSSPEPAVRPSLRRSSLTEMIRAKSGDQVAVIPDDARPNKLPFRSPRSTPQPSEQPTMSEPLITGWPHSVSQDPPNSTHIISLNSHTEGPVPLTWGRKPGVMAGSPLEADDVDMDVESGMRGMDVLAESARRLSDADERERTESPSRVGSGIGPKYSCRYCVKTFSRPSSLRIHTYSHTGERPFVCMESSCGRRFSVQSNLKRHAKVHQMASLAMSGLPPGHLHIIEHPPPSGRRGDGGFDASGYPPTRSDRGRGMGMRIHPPPHPERDEWGEAEEEDELDEEEYEDEEA